MKTLFLTLLTLFSFSYVQSQKIGFEIGGQTPTGTFSDFTKSGLNGEISYQHFLHPKWGMEISFATSAQPVKEQDTEKFKDLSAWAGPVYRLFSGKIRLDVFSALGYIRTKTPEVNEFYPGSPIVTRHINKETETGMGFRMGLIMEVPVSGRVNMYVRPKYRMLFDQTGYQTRDVSSAIDREGNLDLEVAAAIPFENQTFQANRIGIDVGVNVIFAQDWNSSRSNKTSKTSFIDTEKKLKSSRERFLALEEENQHQKSFVTGNVLE